eukprot:3713360-Amphidinium_carterae.1
MFHLRELEDIRTVSDMTDWIKSASVASREAQVTSSEYFVEDVEQRLLSGVHVLQEASYHSVTALSGEFMINGFTFTAWINPPGSGVAESSDESSMNKKVIVRRPLGSALSSSSTTFGLSCWSWCIQGAEVMLEYGAHDHPRVQTTQEVISLGRVPGLQDSATFLVLVVSGDLTGHTAVLYANGYEHIEVVLPRPITDCGGPVELGGAGLRVADLTFYPRSLTAQEVEDVRAFGLPIRAIIRGKASAHKEVDSTDDILEVEAQTQAAVEEGQAQIRIEKSREEMLTRLSSCPASTTTKETPSFQEQPRVDFGSLKKLHWSGDQCSNKTDDLPFH